MTKEKILSIRVEKKGLEKLDMLRLGSKIKESSKLMRGLLDFIPSWEWLLLSKELGNEFLDELADKTRKRDDVKVWASFLRETISQGNVAEPNEDKWKGWDIVPDDDGIRQPYLDGDSGLKVLQISNGQATMQLSFGEDGWDYFINQLES